MGFDFFEEEGEKGVERTPAPRIEGDNASLPPAKKKASVGKILLAIGLSALIFFCGFLACWFSLDKEMRTLIRVKDKIQERYYREVTDEEFYSAVFGGINDGLLDSYSRYMTAEEYAAFVKDNEGSRSGLGLVFAGGQAQGLQIVRVSGNSPAETAGLLAGERITAYGKTEGGMTATTTFAAFSEFLSAFAAGEELCLRVCAANGGERVVKLSKAAFIENMVFYRTKTSAYAFGGEKATTLIERGEPLACLDEDTAYVRLVEFTGNATEEFDKIMEKFKSDGKKNLVLDLRSNGGGYLGIMQAIASYFCKNSTEKQPIAAVADYGKSETNYRARGNVYGSYFQTDSKIYVLADSGTASASECLLGCMLEYQAISYANICLAERGGVAKTFGKGIMQETQVVNFLEKDALKLTTAEIRWPVSKTSIHGRGVLPEDGTKKVAENANFEEETVSAIAALFS